MALMEKREKRLSFVFGLLAGAMWMGYILIADLGTTSVLRNLDQFHPRIYAQGPPCLAVAAVAIMMLGGLITAYRTGRIGAGLPVGLGSGVIGAIIAIVSVMTVAILFHDVGRMGPAQLRFFPATAAEFSDFVYSDACGGALNQLWLGPILGLAAGGLGAVIGKLTRRGVSSSLTASFS